MPRRPRTETRQLVLDTGVRLLLERGLQGGCDHLGMSDVLAAVEEQTGQRITNASVYGRIWPTQAAFHRDLLLEAAEYYPAGEEQATLAAAERVLSNADLDSADGRRQALRDICRVAGAAHAAAMAQSRAWQTWLAIWAITVSTPDQDDDRERGPAIARRHEHAVEDFGGVLASVVPRLGLRPRVGVTLEHAAMTIYALSEGLVLHDRFALQHTVRVAVPTEPPHGGEIEEWTLFSIGLEALLERFFETSPSSPVDGGRLHRRRG